MPQPAVTTGLGASTLARKWKVDVDVSPAQDGSDWRRVRGATDTSVNPGTAGMQADTDYDGEGYSSSTATTQEWGATLTVRRAPDRNTPTVYDPGQEFLRLRATKMGPDNTAHIRAYEWNGPNGPKVEAYEGFVATAYANNGGGPEALSTGTITLTGQGAVIPIAHPDNTPVTPAVLGVVYSSGSSVAAAGGALILVRGSGFLAATAVTVFGNAVTAADYEAASDNVLAVKVPPHAAGTGDVVVTGPGGASAVSAYSKITYV